MGPEAAVNAVFANKIAALADPDERAAFIAEQPRRSTKPTSTCCGLASELVIDAVGARLGVAGSEIVAWRWRSASPGRSAIVGTSPPGLMPYCEDCEKFWNLNSMPESTTRCPTCGIQLAEPQEPDDDDDDYKAPWHCQLLVVLTVVYLGLALPPARRGSCPGESGCPGPRGGES